MTASALFFHLMCPAKLTKDKKEKLYMSDLSGLGSFTQSIALTTTFKE